MKRKAKTYDAEAEFFQLCDSYKGSAVDKYRSELIKHKNNKIFERRTDHQDQLEKDRRQSDLLRYVEGQSLGSDIRDCFHYGGRACRSIACPVCANIFKSRLVKQMRSGVLKNVPVKKIFQLTVYNPHHVVRRGELNNLDVRSIMRWFRRFIKPLIKCGAKGYVVIEVVYRTKEKIFVPHMHFVGTGLCDGAYDLFRETKPYERLGLAAKSIGLSRPVMFQHGAYRSNTKFSKTAMLSYLCKFTTSWKDNFNGRTRCTRPKGQLLNGVNGEAVHVEQLLFLDKNGIDKLFYPIGCRMKRLPVCAAKDRRKQKG